MTRLSDEVVEAIAKNGRAFPNESRDMARELMELRKKLQEPAPAYHPWENVP